MDATANIREAALRAYGALWREIRTTAKAAEARRLLRDALTQDERKKGVAWSLHAFGPVTTSEAIAADMAAGVFPEKSIDD